MSKNHLASLAAAAQALRDHCGEDGGVLADELDAARAGLGAKCVALSNASLVLDKHPLPACGLREDQCGWRQAYRELLDALWIGW